MSIKRDFFVLISVLISLFQFLCRLISEKKCPFRGSVGSSYLKLFIPSDEFISFTAASSKSQSVAAAI